MRVAVLGAGYAGVTLVRRLERTLPETVDLVLVDDTGEHLVQHELHRVVRRPSLADEVTIPLPDVVERATVREARVTGVDLDGRGVELADGNVIEYDLAAVCLGAETADYGLPGVAEHGIPLKRIEDAHAVREAALPVFEDGGRVVVGGAGLSGVQVAGELAALADERDAPVGPDEDREVVLCEQLPAVAPGFPEPFQRAVRRALDDAGVTVRTDAAVERAEADAVTFADGETLSSDAFVWTGGIRGPDALGGERPQVDGSMRLAEHTFVVGDAGRVVDADGEAVPASAQSAVREARAVADSIGRLVDHEYDGDAVFEPRLRQFTFDSPGWVVSVGDAAVAQVGPTVLSGGAARALKAGVGAGYLGTVGAAERAVDLVYGELGLSRDCDGADEA